MTDWDDEPVFAFEPAPTVDERLVEALDHLWEGSWNVRGEPHPAEARDAQRQQVLREARQGGGVAPVWVMVPPLTAADRARGEGPLFRVTLRGVDDWTLGALGDEQEATVETPLLRDRAVLWKGSRSGTAEQLVDAAERLVGALGARFAFGATLADVVGWEGEPPRARPWRIACYSGELLERLQGAGALDAWSRTWPGRGGGLWAQAGEAPFAPLTSRRRERIAKALGDALRPA